MKENIRRILIVVVVLAALVVGMVLGSVNHLFADSDHKLNLIPGSHVTKQLGLEGGEVVYINAWHLVQVKEEDGRDIYLIADDLNASPKPKWKESIKLRGALPVEATEHDLEVHVPEDFIPRSVNRESLEENDLVYVPTYKVPAILEELSKK